MANLFRQAWESVGIPAQLANIADPVLYTPVTGAPATIPAMLTFSEDPSSGIAAQAEIRLSDLVVMPVDGADTITFRSKVYRVVKVDFRDHGMATLSLRFTGPA